MGLTKVLLRGEKLNILHSRHAQNSQTTPKLPVKDWAFQIISNRWDDPAQWPGLHHLHIAHQLQDTFLFCVLTSLNLG